MIASASPCSLSRIRPAVVRGSCLGQVSEIMNVNTNYKILSSCHYHPPDHATLGLVEHEAVVVDEELVVADDALAVGGAPLHEPHVLEQLVPVLPRLAGQVLRHVDVGSLREKHGGSLLNLAGFFEL